MNDRGLYKKKGSKDPCHLPSLAARAAACFSRMAAASRSLRWVAVRTLPPSKALALPVLLARFSAFKRSRSRWFPRVIVRFCSVFMLFLSGSFYLALFISCFNVNQLWSTGQSHSEFPTTSKPQQREPGGRAEGRIQGSEKGQPILIDESLQMLEGQGQKQRKALGNNPVQGGRAALKSFEGK